MSRAFSVARALKINHNGVMIGALNEGGDMIYGHELGYEGAEGPGYCIIDETTLTFNTGFVDREGNEIFTGDIIQNSWADWSATVVFDDDHGAFFTTYVWTSAEQMKDAAGYSYVQHTDFKRLDRDIAKYLRIVGNIYEKLLKAGDTNET